MKKLSKFLAELLAMIAMAIIYIAIFVFRIVSFCFVPFYRAFKLATRDFQEWERQSDIDNGKVKR